MFSPGRVLEAYGDYRESIGRPRVNCLENIKESIPFKHFQAGIEFTLREMGTEVEKQENAEDAL